MLKDRLVALAVAAAGVVSACDRPVPTDAPVPVGHIETAEVAQLPVNTTLIANNDIVANPSVDTIIADTVVAGCTRVGCTATGNPCQDNICNATTDQCELRNN